MPIYDYIIIGAGASGLLLADALGNDRYFSDKSILVLDRDQKNKNDRTWCFWEAGKGQFDDILYRRWPKIHFAGEKLDIKPEIAPYSYKMLRGIDFYNHYLQKVRAYPNVDFLEESVQELVEKNDGVLVMGKNQTFEGRYIFDSRFEYQNLKSQSKYPILQQHFLGWFIQTNRPVFDVDTATFMDFSIPQKGNTRFMYVLPFSTTEALVEYTLFSENVLEKTEYEKAIEEYIAQDLGITEYTITDIEQGNIPMTCHDFAQENSDRILKIGIAGGWAKASTGYTFYSSTRRVTQLVNHIKLNKPLKDFQKKNRFWFYDLLLLDILFRSNHLGRNIFESLFRRRKPQLIFKFLDQDTSPFEELYIMAAPKPWPFIKALWGRLF
ncbi:lycopene cyclase family protein [Muricauda sp. SCSIO 64092]|uniref:lycopene cyclase family protein n=1 Tax=Allomuricauda sp. SCSIO 64092 TaxID=2908842 RepID=UPI001FF1F012|nr:lycopene cyclase family protein [Muricauda sp. SCSIO 64092]UOY08574.1 lycopene cyclase family protein [Muricauda sp. SCSIO 64092]